MSWMPLGFGFYPMKEELISSYLVPWVMGTPLPWNGVVHKALYGDAPWDVFSDGDGYWQPNITEGGDTNKSSSHVYVFATLVRVKDNRISRTAGGGTWGGQSGPENILDSRSRETIGHSRTFSFVHPNSGGASSEYGHWIMHEYVLSDRMLKMIPNAAAKDMVICKITRTFKNSSSGRRQPPQPRPQPLFFPPAIADSHMHFFPPAIVEAGGSDYIQIPTNKTAAKEGCFQEVQETGAKKQKSMGSEGGGSSEVVVWIPEAEAEKEEDSWQVSALENSSQAVSIPEVKKNLKNSSQFVSIPEVKKNSSQAVLIPEVEKDDSMLSWINSVVDFDILAFDENNKVPCEVAALLEAAVLKAVADHDKGQVSDSDSDENFDLSGLFGLPSGHW